METVALSMSLAVAIGFVFVTIVPHLPFGYWFMRGCDFPRMQILTLCLIHLILLLCVAWIWFENILWLASLSLTLAVICWQIRYVIFFTRLWPKEIQNTEGDNDKAISVAVVNLDFENKKFSEVRENLESIQPQILLLIEYNAIWKQHLQALTAQYEFSEGVVEEDGLGIMLFSKCPILSSEVRYLVSEKRASVFATVQLEDNSVNVVGIHPIPPGLHDEDNGGRYNSSIRDAELMLIAKEIQGRQKEKWLVSGDFNDVAWSRTTRMFKQISGLMDPRVGRGAYSTFHARNKVIRFPIDHIFLSPAATVSKMERFEVPGSDHFGVLAHFSMRAQVSEAAEPSEADEQTKADANEMVNEGRSEASERNEES